MEGVGRIGGWLGALCGAVMFVAGAAADEAADRAEAYRDSGDAHRAMGRPQRALADYEAAIALAPDARAYFGRALIFAASRRLDAALADFNAAIAAAPDFADAYFQRGRTLHRVGQNQRSHADHATAIRLDPDHAWAYGFDYRHGLLYERRLAEHRAALRALATEQQRLVVADEERARQRDFLRFQCEEIDAAALEKDELLELESLHTRLAHAERLQREAGSIVGRLSGDAERGGEGALVDGLAAQAATLAELAKLDPALAKQIGGGEIFGGEQGCADGYSMGHGRLSKRCIIGRPWPSWRDSDCPRRSRAGRPRRYRRPAS